MNDHVNNPCYTVLELWLKPIAEVVLNVGLGYECTISQNYNIRLSTNLKLAKS